jgi:hypothetical protein
VKAPCLQNNKAEKQKGNQLCAEGSYVQDKKQETRKKIDLLFYNNLFFAENKLVLGELN